MPFGSRRKTSKTQIEKNKVKAITKEQMVALIKQAGVKEPRETLVIEFFDALNLYANQMRASDIHMEPIKDRGIIRLRIDGILHDAFQVPLKLHRQTIARIKVMTGMRTDEHRAPQDGRYSFATNKTMVDVRVSLIAVIYGEKAVMRLLSGSSHGLTLEDLGFTDKDLARLKTAVKKPWGMILATGPTGSGKTTSIYAVLRTQNKREVNIATIEDPVEFKISGINQSQVDRSAEFTFANGLRSLLRQDPDIIMVGEIRDAETAKIAVNAALTGHKMLSTVHTNDSATTVPRLIDMGIEPFLIASTFNCAIAQRLMRRVCQKCASKVQLKFEEAKKILPEATIPILFDKQQDAVTLYKAEGCQACSNTGYIGRVGIYEVLLNSPAIQKHIIERADSQMIKAQAIKEGMTTIEQDGIAKVKQGFSTLEEFMRVLQE